MGASMERPAHDPAHTAVVQGAGPAFRPGSRGVKLVCMRISALLGLVLFATVSWARAREASACSAPRSVETTAFPGAGAIDVSPMSSIFLVGRGPTIPPLVLVENGVELAGNPPIQELGAGTLAGQYGTFWRLTRPLLPSTSYALADVQTPVAKILTQFTTAAGYDKQPGQAPVLTELRLWRVHYPPEQVGGGSCVFSDYVGYVDLDYQDGALPGTPAEEVVAVIQLSSTTAGDQHAYVFAGGRFGGVMDGPGGVPHDGVWKPALAPEAEYCATMTLYGRNDQAALPAVSNLLCAKVTNVDLAGVSGGCSFGGQRNAGWAAVLPALFGLARLRRRR